MLYRGADFRPEYRKVACLRSLFKEASVLGLSATVTTTVVADILQSLQLHRNDVVIKAYPPDRPNLYLKVVTNIADSIDTSLEWLITGVRKEQQKYPKTVIFARTINCVAEIYTELMHRLGSKAYYSDVQHSSHRLVSMFHAHVSQPLQQYTLTEFAKSNSVIRVLVSTIAFGMGIEIPDIRSVVHWGPTSSMLAFWQEFGRAGRDGKPATVTWYARGQADTDRETFQKLRSHDKCVRQTILETFVLAETDTSCLQRMADRESCCAACTTCNCALCTCCSYCRSCCPCSSKHRLQ